jgi:Fe2+ or Zn2+ uptake regulation protein
MEVLKKEKGPMKRRRILEELERRGHRISLAGLNRILEVCSDEKLIVSGPDGVLANVA